MLRVVNTISGVVGNTQELYADLHGDTPAGHGTTCDVSAMRAALRHSNGVAVADSGPLRRVEQRARLNLSGEDISSVILPWSETCLQAWRRPEMLTSIAARAALITGGNKGIASGEFDNVLKMRPPLPVQCEHAGVLLGALDEVLASL